MKNVYRELSNMETWNRACCDPKTQHLASSVW